VAAFAGETIRYRFYYNDPVNNRYDEIVGWKTMDAWDCKYVQNGQENDKCGISSQDRYQMLQKITSCIENGESAAEFMKTYETLLKLIDLVGENPSD
jgi:hypothetical protein